MNTPTLSRPLRIFILEDHVDTLRYLRIHLRQEGHVVVSAQTIAEAYAAIPEAGCDVLVSDVGLPDGTGWDLLRRLREEQRPHPTFAVAVSAFGTREDRERSKAAGFRHHLLKPFNPDDLDALLEAAARELPPVA